MSAYDPKQTSTFEIMLQTRWARTNWRAVSCGLPWMANVTRHNCATMRSMASYPQPLGARRTDVEVALNETRHSCVWYSTFHRRKKALPEPHACAVGDRAFRGLYALPSVGPIAQRAGGLRARMGDEGKAVGCVPPTALLSDPRTRLVDSSRRHEIITRLTSDSAANARPQRYPASRCHDRRWQVASREARRVS
jgi:hypothetical protein